MASDRPSNAPKRRAPAAPSSASPETATDPGATHEAELKRYQFKVTQLEEQLRQSDRLKAQFVATMSHELRTPLNVVLGFGSLLADEAFGELNGQQAEACQKILESSERLAGLINDLLDFSSLQARTLEFHLGPVSLGQLLGEVVADFRPLAVQKGQSLTLSCPADLPEITADAERLMQTLTHLVDNAVKFTPAQGQIALRASYDPELDAVAIEVEDTGIGIPDAAMHRLFERFYQVDGSNTRLYGGTGLGLSLVKELTERHGGQVSVDSQVGKGSTFRLILPVRAVEAQGPRLTSNR